VDIALEVPLIPIILVIQIANFKALTQISSNKIRIIIKQETT